MAGQNSAIPPRSALLKPGLHCSAMPGPKVSDAEFIEVFEREGPARAAEIFEVTTRAVYGRRASIEKRLGRPIISPEQARDPAVRRTAVDYPTRVPFEIENGLVLIGSDAHYWPDQISCAHRAFVKLCAELKPTLVVMNGDVLDGARISRHPRIGWAQTPTLKQELDTVEQRLTEIEDVTKKAARLWTIGNHDMRFENRLSAQTPEYEGIPGFALKEQFPRWQLAVSSWINDSCVVKHRFKGGIHATHNNTLWAGKTMVTGHLHSLKVTPFDDYNGTRWGVDTGTLANPNGEHAAYAEDNPLNHRSGFVALTFHRRQLLGPEVIRVIDDQRFDFRGQVYSV